MTWGDTGLAWNPQEGLVRTMDVGDILLGEIVFIGIIFIGTISIGHLYKGTLSAYNL